MLSVRLPDHLETQLSAYCESMEVSKSSVVQLALEKHLKAAAKRKPVSKSTNPFAAFRGIGNRKHTTEQIMRMTRGDGWNKP